MAKTNVTTPSSGSLNNVAIEKLIDNTNNARQKFEDKEQNIPGLAEDIRVNGLLSPLVVFPRKDGHYEIKAGSRRYRAVKLLGWKEVPCLVRMDEMTEIESDMMSLAENEDRMNLSPFEKAEAIRSFVEDHELETKIIAKRIGKSVNYVNGLLRMSLNIVPSVKKEWASGHPMATYDVLNKLARIEDAEKQVAAWKAVCGVDAKEDTGDGGSTSAEKESEKPRSPKRAAESLLTAIAEQENPDVSATQCLQYVLGRRKSAPEGLKLGKARTTKSDSAVPLMQGLAKK